jgi:hypothetical protein
LENNYFLVIYYISRILSEMLKSMLQLRNKMVQGNTVRQATNNLFMKQMPKRMYGEGPVRSGGPGMGAMLGVGVGTAGLAYMMYYGMKLS